MSQNEKNNKKQEKGKERENHFYSHLNKIYKEINEQGEIYTEGFTPEQIFYQIEEVSEKIFKEANEKINLKNKNVKVEGEGKVKVKNYEGKVKDYEDDNEQVHEEGEDNEDQEEDYEDDQEIMNDSNDDVDDPSPLVIENEGTDYSDCSSVDEGTYSEDSSPFDPEEMKSKPASELFKTLDKNIRKK